MGKLGTARTRWGLTLRFAGVGSAGGRRSGKTRSALGTRVLLLVVCSLGLGIRGAFSQAHQEASTSAGRPVGVPSQPSLRAATAITQVGIRRTGQQAIVRVEGDGRLTVHPFRLHSPERLVLDFSGARLALAPPSMGRALKPVRGVRAGQFQPDVARVVIDLEQAAPYIFRSAGQSVTVSFALATEASSTEPVAFPKTGPARPLVPVHRTETSLPAPLPPAVSDASGMPGPELWRELTGALAGPVPPGVRVEPSENAFAEGRLTFHAQDQTLRSVLEQIGDKAQVAILLAERLGDEQVSFAFRRERLDEALHQILKGYDVLYFYGVDQEKKGPASLRAAWVYPATHGPGMDRSSLGSRKAGTKEVDGIVVGPSPDAGAKAIAAPAGRKPRAGQSANPAVDTTRDQGDEARTQAYENKASGSEDSRRPPVLGQGREADLARLRKEAEELARLAGSIPAQAEEVAQGKLPKDFPEKLKRIDKLARRLREEVMP